MDEAYLGTIRLFALPYVPHGWMACDGSLLGIAQYNALYSLLGLNFGEVLKGDQAHFHLPKLDAPIEGLKYCICVSGYYPIHQD